MRAWVVRAGRDGEREQAALEEGLVITGWQEVGDLGGAADRETIRTRLQAVYPHESDRVVANWTGQLLRFRQEMAIGDLVVLPLRTSRIAIGRITGGYEFREVREDRESGLRHVRPVEWLVQDLERTAFRQDLLDSMGSLLTVFELSRFEAAERVAAAARTRVDPGRPDAGPSAVGPVNPDTLAEEVARRSAADPLRLTIRDFLAVWDAVRRLPATVDQIQRDLARLGLVTSPPFTEGVIDTTIAVLPDGDEPDDQGASTLTRSGVQVVGDPDPAPVTYRVSNLGAANRRPVSVRVGDTLRSAMTKMILHSYSQLAVLDEDGRLRGVVSWESIGRARLADPAAELASATATAREADGNDDLLQWIDEIHQTGYVFVRDQDLKVTGLITAADLTVQFGTRVRPFVLIEEIEQRLRRTADVHFTLAELRAAAPPRQRNNGSVQSAADLSFGAYKHLLKEPADWARLRWDVDHELFLDWLEQCRNFRNDLMHFSPDELTGEQLAPVEGLLALLRSLDPRA
ncbi:CBS domain-containing protein [Streptomyces sp. NRRL F-5135]|uniref:CBS domain-containing protein n=1 Tax=Streptomyces sp. NRRL F-5135 TaxID=1463858 RepID=UPI00131E81E5|nr:CBS domain-containing protein [Streptomyces sp. NRRL F-5135]